jgi:TIR domain/NACHT domain
VDGGEGRRILVQVRYSQEEILLPHHCSPIKTPYLDMSTPEPVEVFYSYSRKDLELQETLKTCLGTLKRQRIISGWDDRELVGGEEWDRAIKAKLNAADIVLLLISPDFIDSDYCYGIEVTRAMERHEAGEACVIPIILRPSDWKYESVPFNKLTALPTGVEPVTKWANQDDAFLNIAQGIRKAAAKLIAEQKERLQKAETIGLELLPGYSKKYREAHGQIKLLRMPKAVDLETIYTRVRFLNQFNPYCSQEGLEEYFRARDRHQMREVKELDGFAAVNQHQYLMVLGAPGAGKSTFLRRVGLEALKVETNAESLFQHQCIPVFLELKKFKSDPVNIPQAIVQELNILGFTTALTAITKTLEEGKFLVLFDGLDEVPKDNLNAVMEAIQAFVRQYDKNRFIASCRIAAYRSSSSFAQFLDIELAEFNDGQMEQFINNWFRSSLDAEDNTAEKCWALLNSDSYKAAKELAHTPLLLTFLCLVYDRTQGFPSKRAVLYQRALDILLEEWAAEKRIPQEDVHRGLSTDLEKLLLAEIAYRGFESDRLFFTRQELIDQIKVFLSDTVDQPKYLDGKRVLDAIAVQQGILVERLDAVYSFSHLTLQEYLVALYICPQEKLVEALVRNHLTDQKWREVFILVAGLMAPNADRLLELMEEEAQKLIDAPRLRELFVWADQATEGSDGKFKPAAKRVGAIVLVLDLALDLDLAHALVALDRALAFALDLARDLAHALVARDRALAFALAYARNLALKFQKIKIFKSIDFRTLINSLEVLQTEIPGNSPLVEVRQAFADRIRQLWYTALNLNPDLLNLSEAELTALQNYFYANELIVRCKESAVRVTEGVWASIEERMLKVQE